MASMPERRTKRDTDNITIRKEPKNGRIVISGDFRFANDITPHRIKLEVITDPKIYNVTDGGRLDMLADGHKMLVFDEPGDARYRKAYAQDW